MKSAHTHQPLVMCLLFAGAFILPSGCQRTSSDGDLAAVVDEATSAQDAEGQVADEIQVPDGDPEELFQFMLDIEGQELGDIPPSSDADGESENRYVNALRRVMRARVEACDKILAMDIEAETKVSAIRMKLDALRTLSIVDADQFADQYESYTTGLIEEADQRLVNLARASLFQAQVNEFLTASDGDSAQVTEQLEQLLDQEDLNEDVFIATRDAIGWLFQNGHLQIATQGFKRLATSFKDHESAKVAEEAESLLAQAVSWS